MTSVKPRLLANFGANTLNRVLNVGISGRFGLVEILFSPPRGVTICRSAAFFSLPLMRLRVVPRASRTSQGRAEGSLAEWRSQIITREN